MTGCEIFPVAYFGLFLRLHMQADSFLSLYLDCCKEQEAAPGSKGTWWKYGRNRVQLSQELSVLSSNFGLFLFAFVCKVFHVFFSHMGLLHMFRLKHRFCHDVVSYVLLSFFVGSFFGFPFFFTYYLFLFDSHPHKYTIHDAHNQSVLSKNAMIIREWHFLFQWKRYTPVN